MCAVKLDHYIVNAVVSSFFIIIIAIGQLIVERVSLVIIAEIKVLLVYN